MEEFSENKLRTILKDFKRSELLVPSETFVQRTKNRLLQLYSLEYESGVREPLWHLRIAHAFLLGSLTLLVVTIGTLESLPGDALYPVKLAGEETVLSLVHDEVEWRMRKALLEKRAEEIEEVSWEETVKKEQGLKVMEKGYQKAMELKPQKAPELKSPKVVKQEIDRKPKESVTKKENGRFNLLKRTQPNAADNKKGGEKKK